jgi:hypothetical protein
VSDAGFDARGALEAVDRILNRGGDPDAVIRAVLEALHGRGATFARVRLLTGDGIVDAFQVGSAEPATGAAITFAGVHVGVLEVAVDDDAFVARMATLVSAVSAERAKHFRRP